MESGRADRKRFAAKLRRLRDLNGKMTQEELHYASGVPLDLIQNYEQEKSLAKGDAVERLAKALHVSPASFYAVELDNMEELEEASQVRLAAQLIFQLADAYSLEPIVDGDAVGITSSAGYMEYALAEWVHCQEADTSDTLRAYEQGKRTPNDEQRLVMAKAFSVPEEVLTGYGIKNANEGFNYLLGLHHIFGGWASMINGKPAWQLSDMRGHRTLGKFINDWNFAYIELKSTGDKDAYQDWKDHYE